MEQHPLTPPPSATGTNLWPDVRVGCIWLPLLSLRVELLEHPEWDGRPLVLASGQKTVDLCSPEALQAGIHPGLPVREVLALCSDALVLQPDPIRVVQTLAELAGKLKQVVPEVEVQQNCLHLNLRGLRAFYRNNLNNLEQAVRLVLPSLLDGRLGFAGSKFVASVAAQMAPQAQALVVPAEESAAFLAPQSVAFLPLAPREHERMQRFGITAIGQVAALPFSAVQAQFGQAGARAWRLAHGEDASAVSNLPETPRVAVTLRLDDPLVSTEGFLIALRLTLARAYGNAAVEGRAVRKVRLGACLTDGSSWEYVAIFKTALLGRDAVFRALKDKLLSANALPPAPFEEVSLELSDLGRETGKQSSLFDGNARRERQLAEAARQLRARYGIIPLYHIVEVEPWSRIPERRWALMPFDP